MCKKVSIIMGIYNCNQTLSRAIESVLNQTYSNWELIMCDDCSSDNTYEIAKNYADKYENIILIKNAVNKKLAYSLNKCLKKAKGDYISRMDSDDENLPDRLEKQVKFLDDNPEYDVVGCRAVVFDETGATGERGTTGEVKRKSMLYGAPFMHPTIMMKKSVYDALEGYQVCKRTDRGQDLDLWFRFFANGFRGYNMADILYKYHESIDDYKKRTMKTAVGYTKTNLYGYNLLKFPFYYYPIAFKPLISAIIPNKLMMLYQRKKKC